MMSELDNLRKEAAEESSSAKSSSSSVHEHSDLADAPDAPMEESSEPSISETVSDA